MRAAAIVALVAVLGILLVPLASPDSEASAGSGRMSVVYVYAGTATIEEGDFVAETASTLYMLEGSENQAAMEAYLEDPLGNDAPSDDTAYLMGHIGEHVGETVHVYLLSANRYSSQSASFSDRGVMTYPVLDPYGRLELTVKAGDTFTVSVHASVDQSGESVSLSVWSGSTSYFSQSVSPGETWSTVADSTSVYSIWLSSRYDESLYVDYSLEYDGASEPSGSPVAFAVICIAVAALTVALIAVNARGPGWSR